MHEPISQTINFISACVRSNMHLSCISFPFPSSPLLAWHQTTRRTWKKYRSKGWNRTSGANFGANDFASSNVAVGSPAHEGNGAVGLGIGTLHVGPDVPVTSARANPTPKPSIASQSSQYVQSNKILNNRTMERGPWGDIRLCRIIASRRVFFSSMSIFFFLKKVDVQSICCSLFRELHHSFEYEFYCYKASLQVYFV